VELLRISATGHGINYLPEYYAARTGAFARRHLKVEAQARDPWTGVLEDLATGAADVVLGGIWGPAMYAGKTRDLVTVGQLNGRFPMAVVTRDTVEEFDWGWMKGRTVLVPGAGGTAPYEFTAGVMRESGADPGDGRFVRDLSSEMLVELFEHGLGDAIVLDLLNATLVQSRGSGHISYRLADGGGPMPNSVYYMRRDRLGDLRPRLTAFLGGIQEAMAALNAGADSAPTLSLEWPDVPLDAMSQVVSELIASNTWSGIQVEPAACERWLSILRAGGLVGSDVSYSMLVDTSAIDDLDTSAIADNDTASSDT
jgi:NitT/TauT family transport system substrate-binding protein